MTTPQPEHKRPTVWIVLSAILALAVVGLLIWALVTRSDLDDANATITAQQESAEKAGESVEQAAESAGESAEQASKEAKSAYDEVNSELAAQEETTDELKTDVDQAEKERSDAEAAAGEAKDEVDKAQAEADQANAKADAATSCAKGAVNAFGAVFDGPTLREGVEQAATELKELKGSCSSTLTSG